jgi:hypothetical protein
MGATVQTRAKPQNYPGSDSQLQLNAMKMKSLVIVNQHVTVKTNQVLHTPPITLEKGFVCEGRRGLISGTLKHSA